MCGSVIGRFTLRSTTPVVAFRTANRSRATFLIEVNRPPTMRRLPVTLISQTWPFAFALKSVTRWPFDGDNLTSFLIVVSPLTALK